MATKNLFIAPLGDVTLADLRAFLNLDADEDARPPEGERLDYKSDWIDDLGEWVAGFANTYGALIFLGVAGHKGKGNSNRPVSTDGVPRKGELKGRIVSHIEATVRPRPRVEVHTIPVPNDRDVAIIRVAQGEEPPYMFSRGSSHKVPVRIEDQTRPADYAQLDALIRRRVEAASQASDPLAFELPLSVGASGDRRTFLSMWVRPATRQPRLMLDAAQEGLLGRAIRMSFVHDTKGLTTNERRLNRIDLVSDVDLPDFVRLWRVQSDGSVGFATQIKHPDEACVELVDMVRDTLSFVRMAKQFWEAVGIGGRLYFLLAVTAKGLSLHNANRDNSSDAQVLNGVDQAREVGRGNGSQWSELLDPSVLDAPAPFLARAFAAVLREEWGVQSRLPTVEKGIDYHADELFHEFGRPERAVRIVKR